MSDATPTMQFPHGMRLQPFAVWNSTRGSWETSQLDLYGQPEPCSAIWPTCGWMRDGSAYPLRTSVRPIPGSASSSSPTMLLRTPLASDSSRGGETLEQVKARRGTIALSHQIIDLALNGAPGSPNRRREQETLWTLIDEIFNDGDTTPPPSPAGNTSPDDQPPHRLS